MNLEYRYTLSRRVPSDLFVNDPLLGLRARGSLCWVMLNPSTADELADDPTIRKVKGFTKRWGYREARVVNLFANRATKPALLWARLAMNMEVVGSMNDDAIATEAARADAIVCAWGRLPLQAIKRRDEVLEKLWATEHQRLFCVGRNADGSPAHPLFVPYLDTPQVWKIRREAA